MADKTRKAKPKKAKAKAKAKPRPKAKATAKPAARTKAKGKAKTRPKADAKPKAKAPEEAKGEVAEATEAAPTESAPPKDVPLGPAANVALAGQAALAGTRAAGHAVGIVASKAKTPIVVGGGMIAGVAGGLAVVRRRNGRTPQGPLDPERVIAAARRAGTFGEELGRMASLVEQASGASKRK
jgi:hypothetical protein